MRLLSQERLRIWQWVEHAFHLDSSSRVFLLLVHRLLNVVPGQSHHGAVQQGHFASKSWLVDMHRRAKTRAYKTLSPSTQGTGSLTGKALWDASH